MQFASLSATSPEEIRTAFNEAFSDYLVPVQLSAEQMEQKLQVEGFDPSCSVGAFAHQKLVGQILHSAGFWKGKPAAYNSGTGVVPSQRGQHLTQRMFACILPQLKEKGLACSLLEVIEGNDKALRTYLGVGFTTVRLLDSFKGTIAQPLADPEIQLLDRPDWQQLQQFWDWHPSWQHSPACLQRAGSSYKTFALLEGSRVIAYATINPLTNRIPSFGVSRQHRRRGLASRLFRHVQQCYPDKPLTLINVDSSASGTLTFLQAVGLQYFLRQHEMELAL
ncbi:GNAT family N-acetyltransferase [Cesiribacter andamanensis]|uniref:Putative acetyltransferase involved in intracellular survival n=1 Tax=Cesiribacter andamanensis AMV16 TaxID=1279009 RepID=M7N001_9BACT|nr:GNAT family N-acetyltransferase [Cesiribacter andamanensis]EMR02018.1 putative acetyltransferase involved in intracellular survival [Cesiribacter andamanensis AMV16]